MNRLEPAQVQRAGIVGTGVIGSGWAAHFLRMGMDVLAWDPAPKAEDALRAVVARVWPNMKKLGLRTGAHPDRLSFTDSVEDCVAGVDFVQESAPEREEIKMPLLAQIDAAARPATVIASSTSGYPMTLLQRECLNHPERIVVGHPFNPPYLIPLVEVGGGEKTDPEVVDWAVAFYNHCDKFGLKMMQELPGFVANRLQEAMWREALHMVDAGMATVEEIDAAITQGPGLRWPIFGPMLTFHLAGGVGGIAHMLDHFDPTKFESWSFLKSPALAAQLREAVLSGCEREAGDRTIRDLEVERDRKLIAILNALQQHQA